MIANLQRGELETAFIDSLKASPHSSNWRNLGAVALLASKSLHQKFKISERTALQQIEEYLMTIPSIFEFSVVSRRRFDCQKKWVISKGFVMEGLPIRCGHGNWSSLIKLRFEDN